VIAALLTNLQAIFEFAFEKVRLTAFAFDEDIFSLHHAFFRWYRLYSLTLFTEPGHRNAGKVSIETPKIEFTCAL
jgi:hypothetical protein